MCIRDSACQTPHGEVERKFFPRGDVVAIRRGQGARDDGPCKGPSEGQQAHELPPPQLHCRGCGIGAEAVRFVAASRKQHGKFFGGRPGRGQGSMSLQRLTGAAGSLIPNTLLFGSHGALVRADVKACSVVAHAGVVGTVGASGFLRKASLLCVPPRPGTLPYVSQERCVRESEGMKQLRFILVASYRCLPPLAPHPLCRSFVPCPHFKPPLHNCFHVTPVARSSQSGDRHVSSPRFT